MKQILLTLGLIFLIIVQLIAQPQIMNYQGVARDRAGLIIADQEISLIISILELSATGKPVFSEIHHVRTSQFGVFSLKIGTGEAVLASISNVNWAGSDHYIQIEMDATGGNNYLMMGASQLLSVPYAFYAHSAGEIKNDGKSELKAGGVPSQNWSLFGNSKSDPEKDKLGTTDYTDLVFVTDNMERLRIFSNGDIKLKKSLEIGEDLTVKRNVYLNTESGETINKGPLTVSNESPTLLTGSLTVEGPTQLNSTLTVEDKTDLNSALYVNNQSPTLLTGSLTVEGPTQLNSTLTVEDKTDLNSTVNVNNQSPTYLSGNLAVDGVSTLNNSLFANGQVTINKNVTGVESEYSNYPLRVEGGNHGIAVKVNAGIPNNSNNFVTFFDENNSIRGRIEGETHAEKIKTPEFMAEEVLLTANAGAATANVVALTVLVPFSVFALSVAIVQEANAIAEVIAFNILALTNLGVTYSSGAGDYAEWLEKENMDERFYPGDIIGVKAGKITLNTDNADHYMVISRNPIVLGNMPEAGRESEFEKVAFLGQVPVKVFGQVNEGDYIIPSGRDDGFGIAVSPEEIEMGDLQKIVGIAWTGTDNATLNYVNVAVGLNANDVARHTLKLEKKIEEQAKEIEELKVRFTQIDEFLANLDPNYVRADQNLKTKSAQIIQKNTEENQPSVTYYKITDEQIEEGLALAEANLRASGVDVDTHPFFAKLKTDPEYKVNYKSSLKKAFDDEIERRVKMNDKSGIKTIVE